MCIKYYRYQRIEIKTDERVTHAHVVCPDGKSEIVHSFFYQPINVDYDDEGTEYISASGSPYRCIRYTPIDCGEYRILYFADSEKLSEEIFGVLPSENHGFVKVSEENRSYFEYSDGTPYIPIGINMAFPSIYEATNGREFEGSGRFCYVGLRQYERWFKKASENGVDLVRIWIGHPYFTPDTEEAYKLNISRFSVIDEVVKLAKKYGILLKLTVENFRYFDYDRIADSNSYSDDVFRKFNKKLYVDGERCESMEQWITDERFADAWLYKVDELARRYSGDTSVFAIELWNEMNAIGCPCGKTLEWNKKYLPIVSEMFPHNMVINSLGSFESEGVKEKVYDSFCWEKSAFKQVHRYLDKGAPYEICGEDQTVALEDAFKALKDENSPLVFAEVGAVNNCHSGPFKFYVSDDDGLIFADCVYTPFFVGSCGCGHIWHWDERYVESKNLYKMFKPFAALIENINPAKENFVPQKLSNELAHVLILKGEKHVLGYIRSKSAGWKNVLRDLKAPERIAKLDVNVQNAEKIELYDIWNEDIKASLNGDTAEFENIERGCMFKIELK